MSNNFSTLSCSKNDGRKKRTSVFKQSIFLENNSHVQGIYKSKNTVIMAAEGTGIINAPAMNTFDALMFAISTGN